MFTQQLEQFFVPWLISNLLAMLLIAVGWRWPRTGAYLYGIIFLGAGLFNLYTGYTQPQVYVEAYGPTALLSFYRDLIYGWFARHNHWVIPLIAAGQLLIGAGFLRGGRWLTPAVAGGILFFIGISPLGIGSALPAPLLMGVGAYGVWIRSRRLGLA